MKIEQNADPDLLTPKEAAALLKKDIYTLRNWRHEGIGPVYLKPPGQSSHVFYRKADILAFIDSYRRVAPVNAGGDHGHI